MFLIRYTLEVRLYYFTIHCLNLCHRSGSEPQLTNHMELPFINFSGIHVSLLRLIPAVERAKLSFPPAGKVMEGNASIGHKKYICFH